MAMLLVAPAAAAQATSSHTLMQGTMEQESQALHGLSVHGDGRGGVADLRIQMSAGHAVAWEQLAVVSPTPPSCGMVGESCFSVYQAVPFTDTSQRHPERGEWAPGLLTLVAAESPHLINVLPLDDASIKIKGPAIELSTMEDACLDQRGFMADPSSSCDGYDAHLPFTSAVPMPSPLQVVHGHERLKLAVTGDFALEIRNLVLEGPDGERLDAITSESGSDNVQEYRFVRIEVRDAVMHLETIEASHVAWGTGTASTTIVGDVFFADLAGGLGLGEVPRMDGTTQLTGSFLLHSSPSKEGLVVSGEEHGLDGGTIPGDIGQSASMGWLLALLAAVVPATLIWIMVRRRERRVTMEDVEDALHAGQYAQAAQISARILEDDPEHESAHLSRGIALTKAGRLQEAVTHLRSYLERRTPQDGTLHYVLGTALKEMGQHLEAEQALAEAVQRTPALGSQEDNMGGVAYT